jgi:hypothetical protein
MSKDIYFYDSTGARKHVKEIYYYDSTGARKTIKEAYFYDSVGVRRQNYSASLAPVITTPSINTMVQGVAFSQQLQASGTAPITWAVTTGLLPTGITLSSTGLLSGTPANTTRQVFIVTATNAGGSGTKSYDVTPQAAPIAPVITTTVLDAMKATFFFTQTLTATGSTPITYAVQSGTIPAGLTLSSSGVISGTPTTAAAYSFTVRATNSGGIDDQLFTGSVSPAVVAPTIQTAAIDFMRASTPFSQQMLATGDQPITWSVFSGTLPTGVTLSATGVLSGTPTTTTSYSFTIRATNSAGSNDKAFTIRPWMAMNPSMTAGRSSGTPYQYGYRDSGGITGSLNPARVYCPPGNPAVSPTGWMTYALYNSGSNQEVIISYYNGTNWTNPGKACWTSCDFGGTVGSCNSADATYSWTGNVAEWRIPISKFVGGNGQIQNGVTYAMRFTIP